MIYLITILFTICFVIYTKYQFDDEKAGWIKSKGQWHIWGFFMRLLFFAGLLVFKYFPFDWWDLLIAGVINIIIWDIGINVFALNVRWYYVGETSKIDKMIERLKFYVYGIALFISVIGKIFFKNKKQKQ